MIAICMFDLTYLLRGRESCPGLVGGAVVFAVVKRLPHLNVLMELDDLLLSQLVHRGPMRDLDMDKKFCR